MTATTTRAAIYARVSTTDQTCENQLIELRRYCQARGWTAAEYVDTGISGAKDRRPALDRLMTDAAQRRIDAVVVWRLDRFGRNLRHLITAIEELQAQGVAFVSMGESIDTTSPTGRLLLGVLGAFAEFERERIKERIQAGLQRAKRQGQRLGRRRQRIAPAALQGVQALSVREAAKALGVPPSRVHAERLRVFGNPPNPPAENTEESARAVS
jgi:DNA invertase Pin-like site-specific DNA recombinase